MVSCLRFARDAVFRPNMSKDIEAFCHSCPTCAQYGKQAPTEPMLSHPTPSGPWQLVSQDLFEFEHKHYLITVDHYSDFYELDQLTNTQSTTIVDLTKAHFARHGIPLRCLTDNGPQFISNEYKNFAQTYGFEHVTSSPYWSRSNGKAEATVNDAKSLLKKSHDISLAPQNIPRWISPPSQPLLADPPANTSNAVLHKPDQPPPAAPLQAEGPIECLIDPGPQQHEQQTNTSPRRGDPQTPGTQQTTRSGRLIRKPKKFEDFSLY